MNGINGNKKSFMNLILILWMTEPLSFRITLKDLIKKFDNGEFMIILRIKLMALEVQCH